MKRVYSIEKVLSYLSRLINIDVEQVGADARDILLPHNVQILVDIVKIITSNDWLVYIRAAQGSKRTLSDFGKDVQQFQLCLTELRRLALSLQSSGDNIMACRIYCAASLIDSRCWLSAASCAVKSGDIKMADYILEYVGEADRRGRLAEIIKRKTDQGSVRELVVNTLSENPTAPSGVLPRLALVILDLGEGWRTMSMLDRMQSTFHISETFHSTWDNITDYVNAVFVPHSLTENTTVCTSSLGIKAQVYKVLESKDLVNNFDYVIFGYLDTFYSNRFWEHLTSAMLTEHSRVDLFASSEYIAYLANDTVVYLNDVLASSEESREAVTGVQDWHYLEGKAFDTKIFEQCNLTIEKLSATKIRRFMLEYLSRCGAISIVKGSSVKSGIRQDIGNRIDEDEVVSLLKYSISKIFSILASASNDKQPLRSFVLRQILVHLSILSEYLNLYCLNLSEAVDAFWLPIQSSVSIDALLTCLKGSSYQELLRFTQDIISFVNDRCEQTVNMSLELRPSPQHAVKVAIRHLYDFGHRSEALLDLDLLSHSRSPSYWNFRAGYEVLKWRIEYDNDLTVDDIDQYVRHCRSLATSNSELVQILNAQLLAYYKLQEFKKGISVIQQFERYPEWDADTWLCAANFYPDEQKKIQLINRALSEFAIPSIDLIQADNECLYDRLDVSCSLPAVTCGPLVTIIVATHNCGSRIITCLRSLQKQTYKNIEVLIIDDCSSDLSGLRIAQSFCEADHRFRVVRLDSNGGAYIARNYGLDLANGELITLHDSDDWSHPLKIETQVNYLIADQSAIGCTSEQARCLDNLTFTKLRYTGGFIMFNTSSFMWRKDPAKERVGYWDTVRIGADSELVERIKFCFGDKSVVRIKTGPLSFQRDSTTSATSEPAKGLASLNFGVRREYQEMHRHWLRNGGNTLYGNTPHHRHFVVPGIIKATFSKNDPPPFFDIAIFADVFAGSCVIDYLVEVTQAWRANGAKVALIGVSRYDRGRIVTDVDARIRSLIDGYSLTRICYGEQIDASRVVCINGAYIKTPYLPVVRILPP